MSSSSEFKAVNVRRNTVKVTKHNGEKFTAQMPSNSKAFEYAEQLRNYLPENHVHSFERGDGVTWVKTNEVVLHTPITFHNYQKSGDGWQTQSSTTEFLVLSEEDEEYYSRGNNCHIGDFSVLERMPKEIQGLLEREGGKYHWSATSDTQTWVTEIWEHVTINGVCVWDNSYTEQR